MKNTTLYILTAVLVVAVNLTFAQQTHSENNLKKAKALIQKVVDKTGDYELLKSLKDVQYDYTFYSPKSGKRDVSTERYVFDGEASWGTYQTHEVYVFPNNTEKVTQWYDGDQTTKIIIGKKSITDEKTLQKAKFLRKANFYWFTMMPKLLDEGVFYELLPDRKHNQIDYKVVKVGFNKGVGAVQDDFILYINPKTFQIDRFIFTVKGSGLGTLLMEAEYATVNGYTFMAKRKVISGG